VRDLAASGGAEVQFGVEGWRYRLGREPDPGTQKGEDGKRSLRRGRVLGEKDPGGQFY